MIDISQINLNIYSKDELLSLSNSGILFCGNMDLTEFVSKIMEGMCSQEELDKAVEEGQDAEDTLENVRESVKEALAILESI
jgi:hypothetical protein